jgi:hypothetical protein
MRTRLLPWAALLGLVVTAPPPARAAEEPARPTLAVRLSSLDDLIQDARYLVTLAGHEQEAKQLEGLYGSQVKNNGLHGLDVKRPIGLYGNLSASIEDSEAVLLLPIADQNALLDLLKGLENKPEEGKDGVYTITLPRVSLPVYFRFANKYLYATIRNADPIARDRLLDPAAVLPAGQAGLASAVVNLDRIPKEIKQLILTQSALALGNVKDQKMANESEAGRKFRHAALDDLAMAIKALVNHGRELQVRVDLDRQGGELAMTGRLTGEPSSPLAQYIARLGKGQSIAAALVTPESAMSLFGNASLPEDLRKDVEPVVDQVVTKVLQQQKDENARRLVGKVLQSLTPTLKAGVLDAGLDVRGPGESGLYTFVLGARVKDGAGIEKALRQVFEQIPEGQRGGVKLDVAKANGVTIHSLPPDKLDVKTKRMIGDNPLYLAVRDDALFVTGGEKGLEAIKEAAGLEPKAGRLAYLKLSMARLVPLMGLDNQAGADREAAEAAARKAFAKNKEGDRVRLTVEGGSALTARMSLRTELVTFFSLMDEAKKKQR